MTAPSWAARYVGLPFEEKGRGPLGFDCWGLFRLVRSMELGEFDLPDYASAYSSAHHRNSVCEVMRTGLAEGWQRIPGPIPMSLVILRLAGRPWHCGVMLDETLMLHTTAQTDAVVERIDSLPIAQIEAGAILGCVVLNPFDATYSFLPNVEEEQVLTSGLKVNERLVSKRGAIIRSLGMDGRCT